MSRMDQKVKDFSELPSVVWRIILSMLNQKDQVNLLTTSSRMLAHGQLRSLWESVKLKFSLTTDTEGTNKQSTRSSQSNSLAQSVSSHITMPTYQRRMIKFYGHMFRNITISFKCPHSPMHCEDEKSLIHLAKIWKARSLRLIVFDNDDEIVPLPVAALLNCIRLKTLEIVVWPSDLLESTFLENSEFDLRPEAAHAWNLLFKCLEKSKMQDSLQTLRLTLSSASSEKAYCILRHCSVNVASLFPNMQHLQVPLDHLGKVVPLLASARHSQLRTLDVYVVDKYNTAVSHASSADWCSLLAVAPKLKVVCAILSSYNEGSGLGFLPVDVPVVAVTLARSSSSIFKHHHKVFEAVAGFSHSLRLFSSLDRWWFYPNRETNDEALLSLVEDCCKLEHLTYLNPVDSATVVRLSSVDRQWKSFQFVDESIVFDTWPLKMHIGVQRETLMNDLCQKVSSNLGYKWRPLTDRSCWEAPCLSLPAADLVAKCRYRYTPTPSLHLPSRLF